MANRPKESLSGIVGVLGGLYSANKLAKIQTGFTQYNSDLLDLDSNVNKMSADISRAITRQSDEAERQSRLIGYDLDTIIDLQVGTIAELSKVHNSIVALELELSKVTNVLERQEYREEKVGDLKLIIMEIEESLDFIDTLKEDFTPWAAFQTRVLSDMIEDRGIKINDFKRLPSTEIKYVKGIMNRVQSTHRECMSLMEGRE
jgi:hypothetical protein